MTEGPFLWEARLGPRLRNERRTSRQRENCGRGKPAAPGSKKNRISRNPAAYIGLTARTINGSARRLNLG
ncbi:hypothetical protein NL676_029700 [Syzygium grande]|nr:hypothetical protein NL676_029700 [Syzygium grande]